MCANVDARAIYCYFTSVQCLEQFSHTNCAYFTFSFLFSPPLSLSLFIVLCVCYYHFQFLHLLLTKILLFQLNVFHLTQPQSSSLHYRRHSHCRLSTTSSSLNRNIHERKKRDKPIKDLCIKMKNFFNRNIILCVTHHIHF